MFAQVPDLDSLIYWPQCELYFRHVIAIAAHAEKLMIESVEILEVSECCSRYFLSRGRYEEAEKLCILAKAGTERVLGDKHLRTLAPCLW